VSEAELPEEPDRRGDMPHPRSTSRLFGQSAAEAAYLEAARRGRLHHAWLITGPEGTGKATLAWRIARHLIAGADGGSLAMAPDDPVFRRTEQLAAPELALVRRPYDDKARRLKTAITVDEVRGLKGFFQMSAPDGRWRVAIVDPVDELNAAAANALLKMLEEPPDRSLLLLVCHRPTTVLPTIRSRCRELRCAPLGEKDLAAALTEAGMPPDPGDSAALVALAAGSVGRAADLLAEDGLALYREIVALLRTGPPLDRRVVLRLAEAAAGRDAASRFRLILDLVELALSRLARAAAGGETTPTSGAEAEMFARLGAHRAQALVWADAAPRLRARAEAARAVNLDPAQIILDTFLQIDAAASEALGAAA
jgi:DNA polymerase III subunit delta'